MKNLVSDIKNIIQSSRANAVRSVDFCRVQMYWNIGHRIVEEEQGGSARAEYGTNLIQNLAKVLEPEYGTGFRKRQLERARQFYLEFPIASALRSQFNWTQYKLLISISDKDKREYYELEAFHNNWTARELERQINSMQMVLPTGNDTIFASNYQLLFPTEQQLIDEVEKVKAEIKNHE